MTRIDHAAEARVTLLGAGDGRNVATDAPLVAQVHATLALVEQQRVANLIAAMSLSFNGRADVTRPWTGPKDTPEWEAVRAEVASALGIGETS